MAFHAFHTLSFPWPAFRGRIKLKLPTTPYCENLATTEYYFRLPVIRAERWSANAAYWG
jgi:hypothetical protein